MSPAVDISVTFVVEVDEIDEQLAAVRAGEAGRMPTLIGACSVRKDTNVSSFESHPTILAGLWIGERYQ